MLTVIILITFIIRIPSIFLIGPVGWDEDAFFTMAQSVGYFHQLPYQSVLINPPPLTYFFYLPSALNGGDSLTLYRFVAYVYLGIAAYAMIKTRGLSLRKMDSIFIATLFVVIFTLLPEGSGWFTELNSCLVLVALIFTISYHKHTPQHYFFLGVVLSVAVLTRTNLAFSVLGIIILYGFRAFRIRPKIFFFFAAGGLLPVVLLSIVYICFGDLRLLFDVVIKLPLSLISAKEAFHLEIGVSLIILVSLPIFITLLNNVVARERKIRIELHLVFLGTVVSVLMDQPNYGHHLLQLSPFIPLYLATFFTNLNLMNQFSILENVMLVSSKFAVLALSILLLSIQFMHLPKISAYNFEPQSALEILSSNQSGATLWAINGTDIYYSYRIKPVSPLVMHPNNLVDSVLRNTVFGGISEDEAVKRILRLRPTFITISEPWYLTKQSTDTIWKEIGISYKLVGKDLNSQLMLYSLK